MNHKLKCEAIKSGIKDLFWQYHHMDAGTIIFNHESDALFIDSVAGLVDQAITTTQEEILQQRGFTTKELYDLYFDYAEGNKHANTFGFIDWLSDKYPQGDSQKKEKPTPVKAEYPITLYYINDDYFYKSSDVAQLLRDMAEGMKKEMTEKHAKELNEISQLINTLASAIDINRLRNPIPENSYDILKDPQKEYLRIRHKYDN